MVKTVFAIIVLTGSVFAVSVSPEQFFYDQGYKDGYEEGYRKGYEEAKQRAYEYYKKLIELYKADLQALEAGKYLDRKNLITYPRVYRVLKKDGSVEIRVSGCRIEDLRDLEKLEVYSIPLISEETIKQTKELEDLLSLPYDVSPPDGIVSKESVIVELPMSARSALDRHGIPYIYNEKLNKIKAVFPSKERLKAFCKIEGVCE